MVAQPSLEAIGLNSEKIEEARKACANFWYLLDILFNVMRLPYWKYMVNAISVCGVGFKAPTYYDI